MYGKRRFVGPWQEIVTVASSVRSLVHRTGNIQIGRTGLGEIGLDAF